MARKAGGRVGDGPPGVSALDGKPPEGTEYANYFCTYSYIYHQKDMLEDHVRTGAYYNAVMQNKRQFQDKVILDVGAGSGILAIFAGLAGARKVYAVEATSMARFAKRLVEHNKLGHVVEVIEGTIETVELPEMVDVIISEWMGYFLLRESMLDSVLVARDKFLKPGGAMYPGSADLLIAPIRSNLGTARSQEFQAAMQGWAWFLQDMKAKYSVDLDCLSDDYRQEQQEYCMQTASWTEVHPSQLLGPSVNLKHYDLHTVTLEEVKSTLDVAIEMPLTADSSIEGFVGFFDVTFAGSSQNPADRAVTLSTAPDANGSTHWGQMTFPLEPPMECCCGDKINARIQVERRKDNHRLMLVTMDLQPQGRAQSAGLAAARSQLKYNID